MEFKKENIFADLGLENSDELLARSQLLSEISHLIETSALSQKEVAKILGISQPKVSLLVSGKLSAFSTDSLMRYLSLLGYNVKIFIEKPKISKKIKRKGRISVRKHSLKPKTIKKIATTRRKKSASRPYRAK